MAWIRGENISRELLKQLLGEEPPGVVRGQPVLGRSPCAEDTRAQTCLPLKSPFGFPHPHSLTQCNVSTEPLKPEAGPSDPWQTTALLCPAQDTLLIICS